MVLKAPSGPFLRNLAMPSFGIGSPAAIAKDPDAFRRQPVASGPYLVADWAKDDHITLQANPGYAGPKPAYATVIIRDIPDQATSVLSLQKGDIDGLTDPRPEDAKRLAGQRGITIYQQPSNNNSYIAFNTEKKPFDNLLVRRGLAYALDIPAIVKGFYSSGAQVANNWTPPGMLGDNPTVRAYPHDPAKAKALLAQAGFPHGFSTQLYYGTRPRPYMPEPQRVAEAIQAELRAVGVQVTLQPFEWGVYLSKIRSGEHPMCLIGWSGDNGDPDNFFYPLLDQDSAIKPNAQNYSFWRDPTFHRLMLAGQRTSAERERRRLYMRANALVHDQAPAVPLVHTTVPFAMKSTVGGVIPRPDTRLQFELMKPKAS
jgi:peptide/nickel transport system substrate-binding protein